MEVNQPINPVPMAPHKEEVYISPLFREKSDNHDLLYTLK